MSADRKEPDFAASIAEVVEQEGAEGAACGWCACSGCHETSEGAETGHYPFSHMFGCHVGAGCHECGGLGVVWNYLSKADVDQMLALEDSEEQRDIIAVNLFTYAMKDKLAQKRAQGRGGWHDRQACTNADLSRALREHVEKGDPVDVANFAMMIHQRRERIGSIADEDKALQADKAALVAEIATLRAERNIADNALVDRYRDPKTGSFQFPTDVAAIVRRLDAVEADNANLREKVETARRALRHVQTGDGVASYCAGLDAGRAEARERAVREP